MLNIEKEREKVLYNFGLNTINNLISDLHYELIILIRILIKKYFLRFYSSC